MKVMIEFKEEISDPKNPKELVKVLIFEDCESMYHGNFLMIDKEGNNYEFNINNIIQVNSMK